MDSVWVITIENVFDHGTAGVFATKDEAVRMAHQLWGLSDGYHTMRVEEHQLGTVDPENCGPLLIPDPDPAEPGRFKAQVRRNAVRRLARDFTPVKVFGLGGDS